MKTHKAAFIVCTLVLSAITSSLPVAADGPSQTQLAGRAVTAELVTDDDELTPTKWPAEPTSIVTETVTTKSGDSIARLLKDRGIRPDAESYTLVYDLNQTLEKLDPLLPMSLLLPRVRGGSQLEQKLKSGHVVMLTVDGALKERLREHATALYNLSASMAAKSGSFADPDKHKEFIDSAQLITGWLGHIQETIAQRTAKPIRRATLEQLVNEAEVLRAILEGALKPGAKLSPADEAQVSAIRKDMEEAAKRWDEPMAGELPPGEPHYRVVIEIRGKDSARIQSLRVYYVPAGLYRNPLVNPPVKSTNFNGLGSGSEAWLPIKDYKVWAAADGDPLNPVTPVVEVKVRKLNPASATLPVVLSVP